MATNPSANSVTAGFLNTDWNPRDLPAGTSTRNVVLRCADGAATSGSLYQPAGKRCRTVVCIMHPREFMACHYLIPDIVAAGFAAWSQGARSVGNDLRLEHEFALHDVTAGLTFLREQGFDNIVLLGNSGGAGLYSLYAEQSVLPGAQRIACSPAGKRTGLGQLDMPRIQGMVLVGPHPGQGALLMNCIDPSVAQESDALSVVSDLDPLDPANGYKPNGQARYSPEFIERYRAGQHERVVRLDAIAHQMINTRLKARERVKTQADSSADGKRLAAHTPVLIVWRTDADLRCLDLSLDPSDRHPGSLWGKNPYSSNYGAVGFARFCTPESWLSTWSALSSNASLSRTTPAIDIPTLVIEYTGDQACFPGDVQTIYSALAAQDKQHLRIRGDHHGRALADNEEPGRYQAGRDLARWLQARFL